MSIEEHERELENFKTALNQLQEQRREIDRINVQELINKAQELGVDAALSYLNPNPCKITKKISTVLDVLGYTVDIYDYASQQSALYKIDADISKYQQRIDRLSQSLNEAYRYRNEICQSYDDAQNKKGVIDTVMREIDRIDDEIENLKDRKSRLEREKSNVGWMDQMSIDNDIMRLDSEISSKIRQINDRRRDIERLYNDINSLKGKCYNVFWH